MEFFECIKMRIGSILNESGDERPTRSMNGSRPPAPCWNFAPMPTSSLPTRMQAWTHHRYGPPDVLQREELPVPTPGPKDILLRVFATTVNRTDCGLRSAEYVVSRLFSGIFKPKRPVLGSEFAGEVVALGAQVARFKVGDQVFGYDDLRFGAYAEYMITSADGGVALLPKGWSYTDAVALTEGIHCAWCDLKAAHVGTGSQVLVNGATGAIGSGAVQLAVSLGAEVTAVCSHRNVDLVREVGAHHVIDYGQTELLQLDARFDTFFDVFGNYRFDRVRHLLTRRGTYVQTIPSARIAKDSLLTLGRRQRARLVVVRSRRAQLDWLRQHIDGGRLRVVIDRSYPLDEAAEAHRYLATKRARGKVVLAVD